MQLIKTMTNEEIVEWFKNNKPEFIKEKEAKELSPELSTDEGLTSSS